MLKQLEKLNIKERDEKAIVKFQTKKWKKYLIHCILIQVNMKPY